MKRSLLILAVVFLTAAFSSSGVVNAQEKTKEEKEKELQEAIDAQKKSLVDQKRTQDELQKILKEQNVDMEELMRDVRVKIGDPEEFSRSLRVYGSSRGGNNRTDNFSEPFIFTPGGSFIGHSFTGDSERTTWDFTKSIKDASFSRDYVFDVEPTVKTVVMSVNGDCKTGEIRIKIVMPNGKTYSDIVIDEFGNLNWRKSFNISDTENADKAGAWKFEIKSIKATGFFKISLQSY